MGRSKSYVGDVFLIPFEDGRFGAGRVLKQDEATVLIELYKMAPIASREQLDAAALHTIRERITMKWCYSSPLRHKTWEIVGNLAVDPGTIAMPEFYTSSSDGKYYLIPGGDTYQGDWDRAREVTEDEIGDAPPYGIGSAGYVRELYKKKLQQHNLY